MNRYPIRARIYRRGKFWMVCSPTGRHVQFTRWDSAVSWANKAVRNERRFQALKDWSTTERVKGTPEHTLDSLEERE